MSLPDEAGLTRRADEPIDPPVDPWRDFPWAPVYLAPFMRPGGGSMEEYMVHVSRLSHTWERHLGIARARYRP